MITGNATTAGSTSVFQWGDKQDSSLDGGDFAATFGTAATQHARPVMAVRKVSSKRKL